MQRSDPVALEDDNDDGDDDAVATTSSSSSFTHGWIVGETDTTRDKRRHNSIEYYQSNPHNN